MTSGRNVLLSRLVIAQVALTLVLMTCAGLLLRSIRNLSHVNPGFDTKNVISFQVRLSPSMTGSALRRATPMSNFLHEFVWCRESKRQISLISSRFPERTMRSAKSIEDVVSESMASRRLPVLLLGTFARLALILATVGIYGAVSYSVMRRMQEIGIGMALGADRGQILKMIVRQAIWMAGTGLGLGASFSVVVLRLLPSFSHLLYGVGNNDPLTIMGASAVLLISALFACYVPARRAIHVDPSDSLRCE